MAARILGSARPMVSNSAKQLRSIERTESARLRAIHAWQGNCGSGHSLFECHPRRELDHHLLRFPNLRIESAVRNHARSRPKVYCRLSSEESLSNIGINVSIGLKPDLQGSRGGASLFERSKR